MTASREISRRRMLTIAAGAAGTTIGAATIIGTSPPKRFPSNREA